jgi:hypothetical protein
MATGRDNRGYESEREHSGKSGEDFRMSLTPLDRYFAEMLAAQQDGGAPPAALTAAQRQKRYKAKKRVERHENGPPKPKKRENERKKRAERRDHIAVLDFETDPFDSIAKEQIRPFAACLLADGSEPVIIWEEDYHAFVDKVLDAVLALPGAFTVYAHNGGKFDFLLFLYRIRGAVSFKGRGVMCAKIGPHELRDSFHIIPEKLASYKKDDFDYKLLRKDVRNKHREKIISYMTSDCVYLLEIVKAFIKDHGLKLSIGQAAMACIKGAGYEVGRLTEGFDAYCRNFFFGGRVECLQGPGIFDGAYKLYDVNSMYPYAMASFQHPIGGPDAFTIRDGKPGPATCFVDLECENFGALVCRDDCGETTAHRERGTFRTSIFEYEMALKHGLISGAKIKWCIDCERRSDFSRFVVPLYEKRLLTKAALKKLAPGTREYDTTKTDDIFYKLILNNGYGKFAQNPRRFKEHWITDYGERPPAEAGDDWGELPEQDHETLGYSIWSRPQKRLAFNNVATAASITGAARAVLMDAICNARDPVYCDTDSLICRDLRNVNIDPVALGAWDIEDEFTQIVVAGKKLYGCKRADGSVKVRSKGAGGVTYQQLVEMVHGEAFEIVNKAPTLTKMMQQFYVTRRVRATAKAPNPLLLRQLERLTA